MTGKHQLLLIGRFSVVGPLLGAALSALFLIGLAAGDPSMDPQTNYWVWAATFVYFGLPLIVGMGYYYGFIAATLAGIAAALLFKSNTTPLRALALVGLSALLAFCNVYVLNPMLDLALQAALCGVVSSAVCTALFVPRSRGA